MRPFLLTSAAVLALSIATQSTAQEGTNVSYDAPESMSLTFIFHIDDGMAEQDVSYEKVPGSGEVYRPTAATRDMDAPLYAPGIEVKHNFLDTTDTGPYPKGRPLGLTLGEWFAAKGRWNLHLRKWCWNC